MAMIDAEQRSMVARVLLSSIGRSFLWREDGIAPEARRLASEPDAPIASGDRAVLAFALLMQGEAHELPMAELLKAEPDQQELIGTLLAAFGHGEERVEEWIRQNLPTHDPAALESDPH